MKTPQFFDLSRPDDAALAAEAAAGLSADVAQVLPKFLYDELGAKLFDAITALDEYYLTRTEAAILAAHAPAIVAEVCRRCGESPSLIDLGAGNCAKAARLIDLVAPRRYAALDIALEGLRAALPALQRAHPALAIAGVGIDFSARLRLPDDLVDGPALVFFPGSSIGNFGPEDALRLLREAHAISAGGALLIGVDLVKPRALLEAAYDDALGVTAAFNLNVLRHLNRLLDADFELRDWRHVASWDERASRIEMHLEARRAVTVHWRGGERRFALGERIHTENAYKWEAGAFEALLHAAGWRAGVQCWSDAQSWFGVFLAGA